MKKVSSIIFILLFLTACTSEYDMAFNNGHREIVPDEGCTFYATVEGAVDGQTKVYADEQLRVLWNAEDQISIFNKNTYNQPYRFRGNDGDNSGGFTAAGETGEGTALPHIFAVYPFAPTTTIDNDGLMAVNLPVQQHYKQNSFGIGANTMISVSDGQMLHFKNAGGYLSFKLYGEGVSVKRISLRGNNHEKLGGKAKISMTMGGMPVVAMQEDALEFVALTCDEPVTLNAAQDDFIEFWFVLPPTEFSQGFTVSVSDASGGSFEKSTSKTITIGRNTLSRMAPIKVVPVMDDVTLEREALIDFFYALDGPNWKDNTNWCSDKPTREWTGLFSWYGEDLIDEILIENNNLCGTVPASIANLKKLHTFHVIESARHIDFSGVCELTSTYALFLQSKDFTIPDNIGNLKQLKEFYAYHPCGTIPESFFDMENLEFCVFQDAAFGPLPAGFGKLKNLKYLTIYGLTEESMSGPIPEDLYDCTSLQQLLIAYTGINGGLSPKIENLTNLATLCLYCNKLSGPLPVELTHLNLIQNMELYGGIGDSGLMLWGNDFSGKVPAEFQNWPEWSLYWGFVVNDNLDISDCPPLVPTFEVTTLSGDTYSSSAVYNNKLTLFFQWETECEFVPGWIPELKSLYSKYHDKGFDIVSWSFEDENTMRPFVKQYGMPWVCFSNGLHGENSLGIQMWPSFSFPAFVAFDENGVMVYNSGDLVPFIDHWFGNGPDPSYESTDFSADGVIHTLQTASVGAGIDLVLMGDAYSDRLIADGTYAEVMNSAMEAFFSEEPYKSFRNCFNVKYVDVVSKNEVYSGETALGTWFGEGTAVGGNNDKVFQYAQNALTGDEDDALIVVLINRDYYAGTCYMTGIPDGDFGRGLSIAYLPVKSSADIFGQVLRHEAGGHGFAKLADEYAYQENGTVPEYAIEEVHSMEPYGWWKNIDFTGNTALVKWNPFITDANFSSEGIGCYEGAYTYWTGVWRPTENSIMRDNTGGFNAPSRYAIWYRINKLAYGTNWNGTYDDFVAWDIAHRAPAQAPRRDQSDEELQQLPPLAPPVVHIRSVWKR